MGRTGRLVCIVGGVGVFVIAGIIVLALFLTAGAVKAADDFLALLGKNKVREAYLSTAGNLRTQRDEASFAAAVQQLGLTDYASSSWTSRFIENDVATLEGSVTTTSGGRIPLKMTLVHEDGSWKVLSVTAPSTGVETYPIRTEVPSTEVLRRLVKGSLLDFNQAVQARDFKPFYGNLAALWKGQTTAEDLKRLFQEFIEKRVDISGISKVDPEFNAPPEIDHNGWLVLSGQYPTSPMRVLFTLKYANENASWKLTSISVNVQH